MYAFEVIHCFSFLLISQAALAFLLQGSVKIDERCQDKLTNCHEFSDEACDDIFKSWAVENCPKRCGHCQDFSVCQDTFDCKALPGEICSTPFFRKFATQFCRKHCKLCSTVVDECSNGLHDCDVHASCTDSIYGYVCTCKQGYRGNGKHCEVNDECLLGLHDCDVHATCTDSTDGYVCTCNRGYRGNGKHCDPDECTLGLHNCDGHAMCIDSLHGFTCKCTNGYTGNGRHCDPVPREDCQDILKYNPSSTSGVYQIQPFSDSKPSNVYCEMEITGGGWTVFQRRIDGTVDFHRNWTEYKNGFGNASGEYWLGNKILHRMTTKYKCTLRIDLWDWEGNTAYNTYSLFRIDSEDNYFTLHVGGVSGNAGGSFGSHNGVKFSASDRDNDNWGGFCSNHYMGGWWYYACYYSNLNGIYRKPGESHYRHNTTATYGWKGAGYSLKATRMMIKH